MVSPMVLWWGRPGDPRLHGESRLKDHFLKVILHQAPDLIWTFITPNTRWILRRLDNLFLHLLFSSNEFLSDPPLAVSIASDERWLTFCSRGSSALVSDRLFHAEITSWNIQSHHFRWRGGTKGPHEKLYCLYIMSSDWREFCFRTSCQELWG